HDDLQKTKLFDDSACWETTRAFLDELNDLAKHKNHLHIQKDFREALKVAENRGVDQGIKHFYDALKAVLDSSSQADEPSGVSEFSEADNTVTVSITSLDKCALMISLVSFWLGLSSKPDELYIFTDELRLGYRTLIEKGYAKELFKEPQVTMD